MGVLFGALLRGLIGELLRSKLQPSEAGRDPGQRKPTRAMLFWSAGLCGATVPVSALLGWAYRDGPTESAERFLTFAVWWGIGGGLSVTAWLLLRAIRYPAAEPSNLARAAITSAILLVSLLLAIALTALQ